MQTPLTQHIYTASNSHFCAQNCSFPDFDNPAKLHKHAAAWVCLSISESQSDAKLNNTLTNNKSTVRDLLDKICENGPRERLLHTCIHFDLSRVPVTPIINGCFLSRFIGPFTQYHGRSTIHINLFLRSWTSEQLRTEQTRYSKLYTGVQKSFPNSALLGWLTLFLPDRRT